MRPAARDQILGSILSQARSAPAAVAMAVAAPTASPQASVTTPAGPGQNGAPSARPSVISGGRVRRTAGMSSAAARASRREPGARGTGSWFRWVAVAAAAAVLLFVAGYNGYAGVAVAVGASAAINLR